VISLVLFLGRLNLFFDEAHDGLQAVKAFQKRFYDVILMDIQMPIMDGNEAAREIRRLENESLKDNPGRKPAIIWALTGLASKDDQELVMSSGADDMMLKPVSMKKLMTLLEEKFPLLAERRKQRKVSKNNL